MRIVAGEFKNRRLITPPGTEVRPTGERAREALFSILGERVVGARFFDVYAGSGTIGLEALSRGASCVVFVESHRNAAQALQKNIVTFGVMSKCSLYRLEAPQVFARIADSEAPFDIIFADPPYGTADYPSLVAGITGPPLLAAKGVAIVEHRRGRILPASHLPTETRQYGENAFTFYYAL